jgi:hypothetical protein
VLYSVVPTPQGSEPLADGAIYQLNTRTGTASKLITVRQADVGNGWWGAFAVHAGQIYLGTIGRGGQPSTIYRAGGRPAVAYTLPGEEIHGMTFSAAGQLYVANGGSKVLRIDGMRSHRTVLDLPSRNLSHVAFRPPAGGVRVTGAGDPGRPRTHLPVSRASISGRILGDAKLRWGDVVVYRFENPRRQVANVTIRGQGSYRVGGLAPGKYMVTFSRVGSGSPAVIEPRTHIVEVQERDVVGKDFRVGGHSIPF